MAVRTCSSLTPSAMLSLLLIPPRNGTPLIVCDCIRDHNGDRYCHRLPALRFLPSYRLLPVTDKLTPETSGAFMSIQRGCQYHASFLFFL